MLRQTFAVHPTWLSPRHALSRSRLPSPWSRRMLQQRYQHDNGSQTVASQASKKQGKSNGSRSSKSKKWDFEDLMLAWDDVFEALCKDPTKAQQVEQAAAEGYARDGRGFLFVRSKVVSQSKKAGKAGQPHKGFGGAPVAMAPAGTPLESNPSLLELGWSAAYIPAAYLSSLGGVFSQGLATLPDASQLISAGSPGGAAASASGPGGGGSSSGGEGSGEGRDGQGEAGVDPSLLDELQRALRGMDAGRLAGLVGCALPEVWQPLAQGERSGSSSGAEEGGSEQLEGGESGWVGGERAYEPELREFVVLLLARVDQSPAIGADIVMAVTDEQQGGVTQLIMPGLDGLPAYA